jgi:putative SOS response-associated peptidase YedK
MCNEFARRISLDQLRAGWGAVDAKLIFPEALPNMPALDSIRITDPAIILRTAQGEAGAAEIVNRRWSWPGAHGKPVYNFRSDGREFENKATSGRCLIPADGFYEYTDDTPLPFSGAGRGGESAPTLTLFGEESVSSPSPSRKRKEGKKAKFEFRIPGLDWFCIAGLWRTDPQVGEAWTMLTTAPGPDIAPYHDRQIVLLTPPDYARWLDGSAPAGALCKPLPAGTLTATRVR